MQKKGLKVYSNLRNGIHVFHAGMQIKALLPNSGVDELALFIFSHPLALSRSADFVRENWHADTKKFLDCYKDSNTGCILVTVDSMDSDSDNSLRTISHMLELENPIEGLLVRHDDQSDYQALLQEAIIRTNTREKVLVQDVESLRVRLADDESRIHDRQKKRIVGAQNEYERLIRLASETKSESAKLILDKSQKISRMQIVSVDLEAQVENLAIENAGLMAQLYNLQEELNFFYEEMKADKQKLDLAARVNRQGGEKLHHPMSDLFDKQYYKSQSSSKFGLLHYKFKGWRLGFEPHILFDTDFYLNQLLTNISHLNISPLEHYLRFGCVEGVSPHVEFDEVWYNETYPDVTTTGGSGLVHYCNHGWKEGRSPNKKFNTNQYLYQNQDVRALGINPLIHYVQFGKNEGRVIGAAREFNLEGHGSIANLDIVSISD